MNTTTQIIAVNLGDVFGYTATFDEALKQIAQISPQEFAERYASCAEYLHKISYDPTTARFWDELNEDAQEHNKNLEDSIDKFWEERAYDARRNNDSENLLLSSAPSWNAPRDDFRLNAEELAVFKQNGFVVSERLGARGFATLFYRIYSNDLPVFVSADALLHAWHRSYDAMLEELEVTYLTQSLGEILEGMASKLPEAWNQYGNNVLGASLIDADYFLAVASSLLLGKGLSALNCHSWTCPDISLQWQLCPMPEAEPVVFQSLEGNRQYHFSAPEGFALRYFIGEFTVEQIQRFLEQELKDAISPNFVEELVQKLLALDMLGEPVKTFLHQDERVATTLKAIALQQQRQFHLFGRDRVIDFSQFKPRGHYEKSQVLGQYFQAMMWCGRIDLRITGTPSESSVRELGAAIILYDLLKRSGLFEQWQQFEQLLETFVGQTDSMTFAQLGNILDEANISSPADIKDLATLEKLQADILAGQIGTQSICSHYYEFPPGSEKAKLPKSFTVMGQRFTLDSWVMSKVVADQILWDEEKVQRFVPTCLDVAFAALGNEQVVPELVSCMTNPTGHKFRDGLNYQHNLAAVKTVVDEHKAVVWEENIYMAWLATLRELSAPTTDPQYPEAMRTRAWAMKTLNTQLASWTQLRHNTILYTKQVYGRILCYYPAGFVEPRVTFWERFEKMATLAANQIKKTPFPDRSIELKDDLGDKHVVHLPDVQKRQAEFCLNFAQKLAVLKGIAVKELAIESFTQEETKFLKEIVEIEEGSGYTRYNGWYPKLFYMGDKYCEKWKACVSKEVIGGAEKLLVDGDCDKWDALVADVHTNPPMPELENPGSVLHQGVGNVDLLMIAVDNGEDKMVYAGPVLSHYEFEMAGVMRKSDSEWEEDICNGNLPPRPDWTKSYLVTAKNKK